MSLDVAHFAFGAAMTSLVITLFIPTVWYPRGLVVIGGIWAMLPDIHWISPVAQAHLRAFHASIWADVFWFHRTLDRLDPTDSKRVAAGFLVFFLITTLLAEWRSYRPPEPRRETRSNEEKDN